MPEPVTVTQLNTRVRELLTASPQVRDQWVSGEISNLKRYPSGHYYFTLKDPGSEIRAVLFARSRARVDFEPQDNMKVLAFGSVDMYVQRGSYQFIVETMRKSGVGDLYAAFEALKTRLGEEGLFDPSRKRPLPPFPGRIGVVTSEKGAVIHDIITTSASRFPADIILAPALVQGEGAAASIVKGIELLNRAGVDVIIVGRGGGSIEDLWAFNEEPVARAIAASEAPVVSAVGHETDFTIADFVADVRAPTPTGAAAIILKDRGDVLSRVETAMSRADSALGGVIERMRHRFQLLDARLSPESAARTLDMMSMQADDLGIRAEASVRRSMESMKSRFRVLDARLSPGKALTDLGAMGHRLDACMARLAPSAAMREIGSRMQGCDSLWGRVSSGCRSDLDAAEAKLESLSARLEALNPRSVLSRGYGMVTGPGGVIESISDVSVGDTVTIVLRDGSAAAEIKEKDADV